MPVADLMGSGERFNRGFYLLFKDDEWVKWSSREIARRCKVSHKFVNTIRKHKRNQDDTILEPGSSMKKDRTLIHHKTGAETKMKTGNIGRNKPASIKQDE